MGLSHPGKDVLLAGELQSLLTYQGLVDRRTQALSRLNVLEEGMERAQAQYSAADPEAIVVVGPVQRVSRLSALVRKAAAAAGAGLFLAVGIVLLLQLFCRPSSSHPSRPRR